MPRVLYIVPDSLSRPSGGMGTLALALRDNVSSLGWEVDVLDTNSIVSSLCFGQQEAFTGALLNQSEYLLHAIENFSRPDIVHAFDWSTAWAGLLLSKHWKSKFVYHIQLSPALEFKSDGMPRQPNICVMENYEHAIMSQADLIIQVSLAYAKGFPPFYLPKTAVIHNGVNLNTYEKRVDKYRFPGSRPIKALYIGRYCPMKNTDSLISAKIPDNVDLCFAGSAKGGERQYYDEMIEACERRENLHYIGPLYGDKKISALQTADMIIMPSRHEPFGIVALEAMASGTLLLSSMVDGLSEFVDDGVAIPCGISPQAISNAISIATSLSSEERNEIIQRAKERAREFSEVSQAKHLVNSYQKLLGKTIFP